MPAAFPVSSHWEKWKHTNKQTNTTTPPLPNLKNSKSTKTPTRAGCMKRTRTSFSSIPKINMYHWLRFILIIKPRSLDSPADLMRDIFLLLECPCSSDTWKKIMLLCCRSGSVTGQPLPVHLSECSLLSFWGQLRAMHNSDNASNTQGSKELCLNKTLVLLLGFF